MSSSVIIPEISASEESVELNPTIFSGPRSSTNQSPIDDFYDHLRSLVLIGTQDALTSQPALGRVLFLGIVSAAEYYFRSLLYGVLHTCPIARAHAYKESLTFGSTAYYTKKDLGFALLENHSFSSAKELKAQTLRLVATEWPETSSLGIAAKEFNKLCQFRHAAIHSRGEIAFKNLYEIDTSSEFERLSVAIGFEAFQDAAKICQNVVRAYNRFIWSKTVDRWINEGVLRGNWTHNRRVFTLAMTLFISKTDFPDLVARDVHTLVKREIDRRAASRERRERTRRR